MKVTISGSYRKFPEQLRQDMEEFRQLGVQVLSPPSAEILNIYKGFASLRGDPLSSIDRLPEGMVPLAFRTVESAHLEAIARSDLLWLAMVDGYCGKATALEIGWALSNRVPVYALQQNIYSSAEPMLLAYATPVPSIAHAVAAQQFKVEDLMTKRNISNPSVAAGAIVVHYGDECALQEREVAIVRSKKWRGLHTIVGGRISQGESVSEMVLQYARKQTNTDGRLGALVYAANMIPDSGYHDPHARRIYIDYEVRVQEKSMHRDCEWIPLKEAISSASIEPNAQASLRSYLQRSV